ncbi:MAG: glycoside hydrolase family 127 protein [Chloroflexi bacterium]|nr:glycoside hydrolase family 127 protein [Chloroflexota bacterium]
MPVTRRLTPVPFTRVTVEDDFWAPRIETNRTATIPAEYMMCESSGRIAAWDLTWSPSDPNPPHIFWDSDVAKWIEAASYTLMTHPDSQLDALLDNAIAKIARAQQPDGYLNTHYIQVEPGKRWTNLRDCHELYCAGHLIEAAVAHYQATGKRTLLDVLCRYADHIDRTFGREPGKLPGYCGHEEIELALVRLFHVTGERRYLDLARYFVDERGQQPYYFDLEARARGEDPANFWAKTYAYMQAHIPVRKQAEVTGHAVRAMYLYSAMADLANETGDTQLLSACERLWDDLCLKRMYLTGGIGPSASNEGFTTPYDLPDETAYAETCAAVGLVFWNHRMLQFEGNGKYADVMERALYNGTISGVSMDGRSFFYVNPLASKGNHHRKGWFDCACCPPNIARMIAGIGGYIYSEGEHDAWVHFYVQGEGRLQVGDLPVRICQVTRYPWDGEVRLTLDMTAPATFRLHLRIPGWCQQYQLWVNDFPMADCQIPADGYVHISRQWVPGDVIRLNLEMPVQYVEANPSVSQTLGRVALQRGPIVYCLESVDNEQLPLDGIIVRGGVPASEMFMPEYRPDLLGGVIVLHGTGGLAGEQPWGNELYRNKTAQYKPVRLTAVPYYAWDNRAPGEMRVWLRIG